MTTSDAVVCEACGVNFVRHDGALEALATFFHSLGDDRADLHVACPNCNDLVELEVQVR